MESVVESFSMLSACGNYRQGRITRRHLLQVGGLRFLGLAGGALACRSEGNLSRAAERGRRKARARAVILLHQFGGPSCHDPFDMKPAAPEGIRGEFKPLATNVPGVTICERLPGMAGVMNKITLVR